MSFCGAREMGVVSSCDIADVHRCVEQGDHLHHHCPCGFSWEGSIPPVSLEYELDDEGKPRMVGAPHHLASDDKDGDSQ